MGDPNVENEKTIVITESQDMPPDMDKVRAYFAALQLDLSNRVTAIELFLGFAEGVEALGTRVHKLEAFLGVK